MTLSLIPAALAVLLGLLASGAVDFSDARGSTEPLGWVVFGLAVSLVARDTIMRAAGRADGGEERARRRLVLPLELRDGDVRVHLVRLEPLGATLAVLLGLLAAEAVDFTRPDGGTSDWGWAAFALSLALTLGWRMGRRKGRRRRERDPDRGGGGSRGEEISGTIREALRGLEDSLDRSFRDRS